MTGYPTLKFFKSGYEKDDGIKYRGDRYWYLKGALSCDTGTIIVIEHFSFLALFVVFFFVCKTFSQNANVGTTGTYDFYKSFFFLVCGQNGREHV